MVLHERLVSGGREQSCHHQDMTETSSWMNQGEWAQRAYEDRKTDVVLQGCLSTGSCTVCVSGVVPSPQVKGWGRAVRGLGS